MNTYRLYLYGRDGSLAQVSEIECPDDDFAAIFAAERRCDFARAELWLDDRLVAGIGDGEARPEPFVVRLGAAEPEIEAGDPGG